MKKHMLKDMFIVGSIALALAGSAIVAPSVADAKGVIIRPGASHAHAGNFRGRGARGGYGGYGGYGAYGGYNGGYCPPIIGVLTGACLPYGY